MSNAQKLSGLVVLALMGAGLAWLGCQRNATLQDPVDLVISTGTDGGTYIKLGQLLAPLLEESGGAIGTAVSIPSAGSIENISRLEFEGPACDTESTGPCRADLAFVIESTLVDHCAAAEKAPDPRGSCRIQVLMNLYTDVLQLVVREKAGINELANLKAVDASRIFVGKVNSGTRWISKAVLEDIGYPESETGNFPNLSFKEASAWLVDEKLDAAFFMAGTPVEAVSNAMRGCKKIEDRPGCKLLSIPLGPNTKKQGLSDKEMPRLVYENQSELVQTLKARALLVAREDLKPDVVEAVLDVVFDHIGGLAVANIRANEIKLWQSFTKRERPLELHEGAKSFKAREEGRLLIATGSLGGKYHTVGRMIQRLLDRQRRTPPARVVHTNGSLENLRLLENKRTIAIVQYDVALASRLDRHMNRSSVYRADLKEIDIDFADLPKLKRIATLHRETLYVIARRSALRAGSPGGELEEVRTVSDLEGLRVCLGPKQSGTRAIAEAVLELHKIKEKDIIPSYLMVPDMVHRLHTEEIDAGFLVSGLPSHSVQTLLDDPTLRLLSLGARERALIVESAAFDSETIKADKYPSQLADEPDIQTIATRAVLVTVEDLGYPVERITEAIFEGAAFLGLGGSAVNVTELSTNASEGPGKQLQRFLARELPSLPLHEDAKVYYERAGLLPATPKPVDVLYDFLTATWRTLTVLVILVGAFAALINLKQDRTAAEIGRRIIKVKSGEPVPEKDQSVQERLPFWKKPAKEHELHRIRDLELPQRVMRRWWHWGDIDQAHWRRLRDMANDRISDLRVKAANDPPD